MVRVNRHLMHLKLPDFIKRLLRPVEDVKNWKGIVNNFCMDCHKHNFVNSNRVPGMATVVLPSCPERNVTEKASWLQVSPFYCEKS